MKHKKWIYPLISALFAVLLAISSIGNLITGYELPVEAMWKIWLWCAFAAIAVAALFQIPHGGKITLGLSAIAVFGICVAELLRPHILKQIETLCYCISFHYHEVYNWPILGAPGASDVSAPLILWAILVAISVNCYICRRTHIALAIVPAVLPLVLCLLTADKFPHAVYPYLLILGLAILLITDWTRRTQPAQSMKLVLWFAAPIALFLALLFICNPQADYVNRAGEIQKEISVWLEDAKDTAIALITGTPINNSADKQKNLQIVGAKSDSTRSVMIVNSPVTKRLYLRERDYDVYTGTTWEASADRKEKFTTGKYSVGTLTILTFSTQPNLLVPYYATAGMELINGAADNKDNLQHYRYSLGQMVAQTTPFPNSQYKKLPEETQKWAGKLLRKLISEEDTTKKKIAKIQAYVRNSAEYDTSTARMKSSINDFAQWFLEESDTGYCIHYATATTVLLRAAGIPARYVEGYVVNGKAGTDVVVTKQEAHAWVEYYDYLTSAWYIVESTPIYPEVEAPKAAMGKPRPGGIAPGDAIAGPTEDAGTDDTEESTPEESTPDETIPEEERPAESVPTDPTTPDDSISPDGSTDNPTHQNLQAKLQRLLKWIKAACKCLLFLFCIWLQRYARIYRKRKLWNCGAPNKRTIWRWRQTRSTAKHLKQLYPEELDDLAKKARFSQHEIQPEELQKFDDYQRSLSSLIAQKPWYQRLFYKWIMAID